MVAETAEIARAEIAAPRLHAAVGVVGFEQEGGIEDMTFSTLSANVGEAKMWSSIFHSP